MEALSAFGGDVALRRRLLGLAILEGGQHRCHRVGGVDTGSDAPAYKRFAAGDGFFAFPAAGIIFSP